MTELELTRALRGLRLTLDMFQTELRHGRVDEGLVDEIESQMERGISIDPRCLGLGSHVDALRESTLTPRAELLSDTIRACDKLKSAIEGVLAKMS